MDTSTYSIKKEYLVLAFGVFVVFVIYCTYIDYFRRHQYAVFIAVLVAAALGPLNAGRGIAPPGPTTEIALIKVYGGDQIPIVDPHSSISHITVRATGEGDSITGQYQQARNE